MKKNFVASSSRGSALLIVLGFLSFMMISAVSFAIYMRIERQATSNYRHTLVARHLLGSALTRAIAEVDAELDDDYQNTAADKEGDIWRFPSHSLNWEGIGRRTFLSVSDSTNEFARVVSYDSLGYVPALFMNELRFLNDTRSTSPHANWVQFSAPAERVRDESVNNGIPTFYFGGSNVVGRYAFACLNMSDLLNFNICTNLRVRDTAANRVSVASIFNASAVNDLQTRLQTDLHYSTVLDFYAGMHDGDLPVFPNSPYHKRSAGQRNSALAAATNHVLVTDGFARVQKPRVRNTRVWNEKACNISLDETSDAVLSGTWNEKFKTAMNGALPRWTAFTDTENPIFPIILSDYLAAPGAGMTRLDIPSVKMAPMVYQITLSRLDPKTTVETEGVAPNERKVCYVWPVGDSGGFVEVGLMFPFRNSAALVSRTFTVDAEVNIYLLEGDPSSAEAPEILPGAPLFCPTLTSSKTVTVPSSIANEQQCFLSTAIPIGALDKIALTAYEGRNMRVVFAVFVTVRQGGNYFDSVPHVKGQNPAGSITSDRGKMAVPKLYFQQAASFLVSDALAERAWPLEYYSLKCPDPRYNFAIANWYVSASPSIDGGAMLTELRSASLLGVDGRDSDVFMFASGQRKLQSPGELGFLVRPYNNSASLNKYKSFSEALKSRTITQLADYNAFYRTVRLYDHGGTSPDTELRDPIYEWFYAANEDESVDGARVNPHSDLPPVLSAAISKVPLDYYYAYQNRTSVAYEQKTFDSTYSGLAANDWKLFAAAWLKQFRINQQYLKDVNQRYDNKFLFEIYGDSVSPYQWTWYSGNPRDIFNVSLSGNLFEVDRKMLYSFSLESFSDRQQLFLYILQAEATGSTVGSSSKSSAGGRAVAVVWRDPDLNQKINPKRHDTRILYFKQLDN